MDPLRHRDASIGNPSADDLRIADVADALATELADAELVLQGSLPRQVVHGDFWDNNVLFRDGEIVVVLDLDFMGERARIDDLALDALLHELHARRRLQLS